MSSSSPSSTHPPLATIAILSIGEMGLGFAKLLLSQGYRVVTNLEGRSKHTATRISQTSIEVLPSDRDLVEQADYIFSIVPPRDAFATAKRISTALTIGPAIRERPLYYLDLNAISPQSARDIAELFSAETLDVVRMIDGGIIGGAPTIKSDAVASSSSSASTSKSIGKEIGDWKRPSIPLSGPHKLSDAPISGRHLSEVLNSRHITSEVGSASGLKMAFASTTKGFAAICIQAFTTAHNLGVLDELKDEMRTFNPKAFELAGRLVTQMPPKAYRWVGEMEEIGKTFDIDGGFGEEGNIFRGAKETYRIVADETILGEEKTESRKRGRTIDDVAITVQEGLKAKRSKK